MNTTLILRKLDSLARCVRRIEAKRPPTVEELRADFDLQDIICVNLERAVQISVDIASIVLSDAAVKPPVTMGEAFARLAELHVLDVSLSVRLQKAVGFRNIAVHEYDAINWDKVFSLVTTRLDDFRRYGKAILASTQKAG